MTFFYHPFTYDVPGDNRGFMPLGMEIRKNYLKWEATKDEKHLNTAVPLIARLIGWCWKKLFGSKALDPDVLDPVAYKIIIKFVDCELPVGFHCAHWLRTLVRRNLLRIAYKTYVPEEGDKSIRGFSYKPYMSPADVEHRIFVSEVKELLLDYIETSTRFDEDKRSACRYLAIVLMEEKMPSPMILKVQFGIPYSEQAFYVDFTMVILRNELYKLRKETPHLYSNEREPFVAVFGDDYNDFEEEMEEEDAAVCDF